MKRVIAISSKSQSFGAIAKYLVAGRSGQEWDRVAWTASRHLPTADPELAGKIMRATAEQSDRVARPVYHMALSFDPSDSVDRTMMERVADDVLHRLELREYQVVMVAHRDRDHQHVHLLVNRVHPETGRAWEQSYDYRAIQQVLREEERLLGLREVPGRLAHLAAQEVPAPATHPTETPRRESEMPVSPDAIARDVQAYEHVIALGRARIEAEMAVRAALARRDELGIAIERAEQTAAAFDRALGRVYRDPGEARVVFTRMAEGKGIDEAVRGLRTEPERFGALRTTAHARLGGLLATQDGTDARLAARAAAEHGREAFETEQAVWRIAAESRIRRLEDTLAREFMAVYRTPEAAHAQFMQAAAERGAEYAAQALRERPDSLGALRTVADGRDDTATRVHARLGADAAMSIERARHEINGRGAAITPAAEHAAAEVAVEQAQAYVQAVRTDERGQPRREEMARGIAHAIHRLSPREVERLHTALTKPQWALVQQLKATVRDVLLGRDEGREQ